MGMYWNLKQHGSEKMSLLYDEDRVLWLFRRNEYSSVNSATVPLREDLRLLIAPTGVNTWN